MTDSISETGFVALVGAGYDLRLGPSIFLNPVVDLVGRRMRVTPEELPRAAGQFWSGHCGADRQVTGGAVTSNGTLRRLF
jgi:hypothetical protein